MKVRQAEIPQIQPTFTTTTVKQEGNSHQNDLPTVVESVYFVLQDMILLKLTLHPAITFSETTISHVLLNISNLKSETESNER